MNEEAAAWLVRQQRGALSLGEREAFDLWIGNPYNAVSYARVEAAWDRAARLNALPRNAYDGKTSGAGVSRRLFAASTAAAMVGAAGAIWALNRPRIYGTEVGSRRTITLPDGSVMNLNTASRVEVAFTEGARNIRLLKGEVLFDVAKNPLRPFIVQAGDAAVRAVGTAFNVRLREKIVEVTVTEGVVAVRDINTLSDAHEHRVTAGRGVMAGPGAIAELDLRPEAVQQRVVWTQGVIDLNGQTLEQAAAEFNRYSHQKIVIGDATIASTRVGGTFHTDEANKFLAALKAGFGVKTVRGENGTVYLVPDKM